MSILASILLSAGFNGFITQLDQTKDFGIGMCCFSIKQLHLGVRAQAGQLGVLVK